MLERLPPCKTAIPNGQGIAVFVSGQAGKFIIVLVIA
jgi:hypothetical protein